MRLYNRAYHARRIQRTDDERFADMFARYVKRTTRGQRQRIAHTEHALIDAMQKGYRVAGNPARIPQSWAMHRARMQIAQRRNQNARA